MKPLRRDWVSLVFAVVVSYAGIVLAESTVTDHRSVADESGQVVAQPPVALR